ncbi:hypothetical protein N9U05_00535, partial [bacterium]|nr:hypothetical protein [bacterium]
MAATDNFSDANIIGKGMSGNVYKATLCQLGEGAEAGSFTASQRRRIGGRSRPRPRTEGVEDGELVAAVKVIHGETAYGDTNDEQGDDVDAPVKPKKPSKQLIRQLQDMFFTEV